MRKSLIVKILLLFSVAGMAANSQACRFTVREIGFSTLNATTYTLLVVDGTLNGQHPDVLALKKKTRSSNIRIKYLHPDTDARHPLVVKLKQKGVSFPNAILCGSEDKLLPLYDNGSYTIAKLKSDVADKILLSPLRKQLLENINKTFAYVIFMEGTDKAATNKVRQQVKDACKRIEDIMPLMPKTVELPPAILDLTADSYPEEKVFLWSIGMNTQPQQPQALVVYGRGRFMGSFLNAGQISQDCIYKYLAMVGADCECNLDRKWMLGTQLPLLWSADTRQKLADQLTFDVDNPSILAEMSRILAQENTDGTNATTSFSPETIDLDEAFESKDTPEREISEKPDHTVTYVLIATFVMLLVIAAGISVFIIKRKK